MTVEATQLTRCYLQGKPLRERDLYILFTYAYYFSSTADDEHQTATLRREYHLYMESTSSEQMERVHSVARHTQTNYPSNMAISRKQFRIAWLHLMFAIPHYRTL